MLSLLFISIICVWGIIYFEINSNSIGSNLGSLFAGILLPYLFLSIVDLSDNKSWKSSQRKLKRAGILQKDTIIRTSFAYLFRIEVDGKYFLVQNNRTKKYQPVGGAYKFFKEEANYLRDNIPVENDNRIPVNEITERDYRLLVKNKYLRKFVKRFNNTGYRESSSNFSREFIEELFSTGILDKNSFGDLSYKYIGRHMTNVEYSSVFSHYELLLADIIELELSNEQEELFRNLMKKDCTKYYFASSDEIKSLGVMHRADIFVDDIATHTPKILRGNTDGLTMRNKHKEVITVQI